MSWLFNVKHFINGLAMIETILTVVALMLIGIVVGVFVALTLIYSWMDKDE